MCAVSIPGSDLHDFFAVLALAAMAGTIALIVLKVVSRAAPNASAFRALGFAHSIQLPLAAVVATVASLGSLYFSEHYGPNIWVPCRFCWFQRVFMYSSAVVLIVAAIRRDRGARWYAGALAGVGILVSSWHILLEHGVIEESSECVATTPCATPWWVSFGNARDSITVGPANWYGITLAVMAFTAFAFILALLFLPEPLDTLDTIDTSDTLEDGNGEPAAG